MLTIHTLLLTMIASTFFACLAILKFIVGEMTYHVVEYGLSVIMFPWIFIFGDAWWDGDSQTAYGWSLGG